MSKDKNRKLLKLCGPKMCIIRFRGFFQYDRMSYLLCMCRVFIYTMRGSLLYLIFFESQFKLTSNVRSPALYYRFWSMALLNRTGIVQIKGYGYIDVGKDILYFIVRDNKIARDYIGEICGIIVEECILRFQTKVKCQYIQQVDRLKRNRRSDDIEE